MTADDLGSVHALERSAQQNPWSLAQFAQELDNPVARVDLCLRNGELAGFLCSWWIAGELQIQNVATAPAFRRQGVAARLLGEVMGRALGAGLEAAWLEVRTGNAAAIALYERFGFRAAGVRPRYYADGEDALMMCYRPEAG